MALNISVPKPAKSLPRVEMQWAEEGAVLVEHSPAQETVISYHNNLEVPVWVGERTGAITMLQPRQGRERVFGVRISRRFHQSTRVSYDLCEMTEAKVGGLRPDVGLQAMAESYNPYYPSMTAMGTSKDIVFTTTRRLLEDYGGAIYHEASDLVISLTYDGALHPGAPQSRLAIMREELADNGEPLFLDHPRISIAIIDNERVYGDKYVNLGGEVYLARATQSTKFPSGVYVSRDGVVTEAGIASKPTVTRYSFEEVPQAVIGLYDSREQALCRGNPERAAEERTALLKSQSVILKNELENQTLDSKLKSVKEQSRYEKESLRRKDYYDHRSYHRKDSSEEMKYVFAAIAGLFGVLALILK